MVKGVQHSKALLDQVVILVMDGIHIAKTGVGLGALTKLYELISAVKSLVEEAPQALPELLDLDSAESGELAQAAYAAVKKIVASVAA